MLLCNFPHNLAPPERIIWPRLSLRCFSFQSPYFRVQARLKASIGWECKREAYDGREYRISLVSGKSEFVKSVFSRPEPVRVAGDRSHRKVTVLP